MELCRGQDTAQIKQLLQDQGFDATLPENQAKEFFTIFPYLYPHRASEKFVSHKNFTNSVLNGAMMGGPICTSP